MTSPAIRVLLIEDNPGDAELIQIYLQSVDDVHFLVSRVDRLSAGLEQVRRCAHDIILLDLSLPESHGLLTLVQLQQQGPLAPVVILTGLDEKAVGLEAVRLGAQDYLIKGQINSDLLARAIRHAIERFRVDAEARLRENHLRLITEQLPAVLWTTDAQLRFSSSLGQGMMGLTLRPENVIGRALAEHFRTDDVQCPLLQAHERALAGESVSLDLDWMGRIFHAHVEPLRLGQQHIGGTIAVALDITDARRVEEELLAARKIQQGLLPKSIPDLPNFDIGGASYPAEATGGDYFDFIPMHDGSLKIVVGDVSGHGFGPALLAASARAYVRALAHASLSLPDAMALANHLLGEDLDEDRFITLFMGRLYPKIRTLIYASAGHSTGYILDRQAHVKYRLESTGLPLGTFPNCSYEVSEMLELQPSDMVLLVTDGVLEAMAPDDTMFGAERALAIVRLYRDDVAQDIVDNLYHAVRAFCHYEHQIDDISAVLLKVREEG